MSQKNKKCAKWKNLNQEIKKKDGDNCETEKRNHWQQAQPRWMPSGDEISVSDPDTRSEEPAESGPHKWTPAKSRLCSGAGVRTKMKIEDILRTNPLERPICLGGSTVIARFRDRGEVLGCWEKIRPLLHSMNPYHRPLTERSWKVGKNILPISLVVQIEDGQEIRCFPDMDFEIEALENLTDLIGIENVEVVTTEEQEGE